MINICKILLIVAIFCIGAFAGKKYVRDGASGTFNGSDWTNAYDSLPDDLTRGDTFYLADGNYPNYTFDDASSGTTKTWVIKATAGAHGTETGWNSAYGDGVALFTPVSGPYYIPLRIKSSYLVIDGVTGGGPGSWESGFGIRCTTDNRANIRAMAIGAYAEDTIRNVTIRHIDLRGPAITGISTGIYALLPKADSITIEYVWSHGHGEGLMKFFNFNNSKIQYSELSSNLFATVEHHGSGIIFDGNCSNNSVRYNRFRNVRGTGWCGLYGTGPSTHSNYYVYGNIFFADSTVEEIGDGVIYNADSANVTVSNWSVYNNTFFNIPAAYALYALRTYRVSGTNEAKNNLVYRCGGPVTGQGFTNANNDSATSNPFVDTLNRDFHLAANTSAGSNLGAPYNYDMDGVDRSTWSRGAYEYVADTSTRAAIIDSLYMYKSGPDIGSIYGKKTVAGRYSVVVRAWNSVGFRDATLVIGEPRSQSGGLSKVYKNDAYRSQVWQRSRLARRSIK